MTPENLNKLIIAGENESIEFKTSFNSEVIETLVAFANTHGGIDSCFIHTGISNQTSCIQRKIFQTH